MKKLILIVLLFSGLISAHSCTQFSSNSEYLVITNDNVIKIFNVKKIEKSAWEVDNLFNTLSPSHKLDNGSPVLSIAISADNKYLVTTSSSGSKMWNLAKGSLVSKL